MCFQCYLWVYTYGYVQQALYLHWHRNKFELFFFFCFQSSHSQASNKSTWIAIARASIHYSFVAINSHPSWPLITLECQVCWRLTQYMISWNFESRNFFIWGLFLTRFVALDPLTKFNFFAINIVDPSNVVWVYGMYCEGSTYFKDLGTQGMFY